MYYPQLIASLAISLVVIILIIRLVQTGKLDIAYCWLWLAIGFGMLLMVLRYDFLLWLSKLIGSKTPTTTVFLLGIIVLLLLCLQFSLVISAHRRRIKKLSQEIALLKEQLTRKPPTTE